MEVKRADVRKALPWVASALFTAVVLGPVGEFFIELARENGWYAHPTKTLGSLMTLFSFAGAWWFQWIAALVIGITAGMWIDAIWRRKESPDPSIPDIDREAVAAKLEDLSKKITALIGEFRGPIHAAFWRDAGTGTASMQASRAELEGRLIEKYSERHGAEVAAAIALAQKCIQLDYSDVWQMELGAKSEYDLDKLGQYLARLAIQIRFPQPTIPMRNTPEELMARARAEKLRNQSLPSTEPEKPL